MAEKDLVRLEAVATGVRIIVNREDADYMLEFKDSAGGPVFKEVRDNGGVVFKEKREN